MGGGAVACSRGVGNNNQDGAVGGARARRSTAIFPTLATTFVGDNYLLPRRWWIPEKESGVSRSGSRGTPSQLL